MCLLKKSMFCCTCEDVIINYNRMTNFKIVQSNYSTLVEQHIESQPSRTSDTGQAIKGS